MWHYTIIYCRLTLISNENFPHAISIQVKTGLRFGISSFLSSRLKFLIKTTRQPLSKFCQHWMLVRFLIVRWSTVVLVHRSKFVFSAHTDEAILTLLQSALKASQVKEPRSERKIKKRFNNQMSREKKEKLNCKLSLSTSRFVDNCPTRFCYDFGEVPFHLTKFNDFWNRNSFCIFWIRTYVPIIIGKWVTADLNRYTNLKNFKSTQRISFCYYSPDYIHIISYYSFITYSSLKTDYIISIE